MAVQRLFIFFHGAGFGVGDYGYHTSFGPPAAYSNLWVDSYLSTFSDPVKTLGKEPPLVLTRGTWAGGQKHGIVLWSSDIWSTFEELAAQVSLLTLGTMVTLGYVLLVCNQ